MASGTTLHPGEQDDPRLNPLTAMDKLAINDDTCTTRRNSSNSSKTKGKKKFKIKPAKFFQRKRKTDNSCDSIAVVGSFSDLPDCNGNAAHQPQHETRPSLQPRRLLSFSSIQDVSFCGRTDACLDGSSICELSNAESDGGNITVASVETIRVSNVMRALHQDTTNADACIMNSTDKNKSSERESIPEHTVAPCTVSQQGGAACKKLTPARLKIKAGTILQKQSKNFFRRAMSLDSQKKKLDGNQLSNHRMIMPGVPHRLLIGNGEKYSTLSDSYAHLESSSADSLTTSTVATSLSPSNSLTMDDVEVVFNDKNDKQREKTQRIGKRMKNIFSKKQPTPMSQVQPPRTPPQTSSQSAMLNNKQVPTSRSNPQITTYDGIDTLSLSLGNHPIQASRGFEPSCADLVQGVMLQNPDVILEGVQPDGDQRWVVRMLSRVEKLELWLLAGSGKVVGEENVKHDCADLMGHINCGGNMLMNTDSTATPKKKEAKKEEQTMTSMSPSDIWNLLTDPCPTNVSRDTLDEDRLEYKPNTITNVNEETSSPPREQKRTQKKDIQQNSTTGPSSLLGLTKSKSCPIDIDKDIFIIDDLSHVQAVHDMAAEHLKHGNFNASLEVFDKIYRSHKDKFGETSHLVASSMHNMGVVCLRAGRYEEALAKFEESTMIRKRSSGEHHPVVCVSLVKTGIVLFALQEYDEALKILDEALRIRQSYDEYSDHDNANNGATMELSKIWNNIACIHAKINNPNEALYAFTKARDVQRIALATNKEQNGGVPDEDDIMKAEAKVDIGSVLIAARTLCNLGSTYLDQHMIHQAIQSMEEALTLQTSVLRIHDKTVLTTLCNLAFSHSKAGDNDQALQIYNGVLRSQIARLGPLSFDSAETMGMMSLIFIQQRKYKDAIHCLQGVLGCQEKHLPDSHPAVLRTKKTIAKTEDAMRRESAAVWV